MAEGNQTAATQLAAAAEVKPLTLARRMAAIRADAFGIGKQDIKMEYEGKSYTIKGHTVEAVLSEMRPLLVKHGVGLTPLLRERVYSGNRCDLLIDFEFQNLDDETEIKVVPWAGAGTDKADKGFSKAGTNALKEMLKKVFLITDRDDAAEETDKVDHQTDDGISRAAAERDAEKLRKVIEDKAKLVRGALKKATTLDDLLRLEREHKAWIKDLPDVTRTFFLDLIRDRKEAFAPPSADEVEKAEADGSEDE
jgi:hypothetical protein